jgi:hypothetical protein
MPFALRLGNRDYPLAEGRFLIGRGEACQMCLDDPIASRNHAAIIVEGENLTLEDLGSRNGVFLNKNRVEAPLPLRHGDVIRIGAQEITVLQRRAARAETLAQSPVTRSTEVFGVLGALADKALALGRGDEAERILSRQLDQLLEQLERGEALADDTIERCSSYGLRIAQLTRKGKWLDFLFRLYGAAGRLMDSELVNDLYPLSSAASGSSRKLLRAYVDSLGEQAARFGPSERFVLSRIEGLEKQL